MRFGSFISQIWRIQSISRIIYDPLDILIISNENFDNWMRDVDVSIINPSSSEKVTRQLNNPLSQAENEPLGLDPFAPPGKLFLVLINYHLERSLPRFASSSWLLSFSNTNSHVVDIKKKKKKINKYIDEKWIVRRSWVLYNIHILYRIQDPFNGFFFIPKGIWVKLFNWSHYAVGM